MLRLPGSTTPLILARKPGSLELKRAKKQFEKLDAGMHHSGSAGPADAAGIGTRFVEYLNGLLAT
jgi:hypothetical protein